MRISLRTDQYTLAAGEVDYLIDVLAKFRADGLSPVEPNFYDKFPDCYELLPSGLRRFMADFRETGTPFCQIHGFPIDDSVVGPTPRHWKRTEGYDSTIESDTYLAMVGSALGFPFAWATLQYGRLIQDIFPIRGDERRESGHGSEEFLKFHTDDAFRPDSADYLLLFGVRNYDRVPTFVAAVRDLELSAVDVRVLSEPRYHILPDDEHIRQLQAYAPHDPALAAAIEMRDHPRPVPVLYGDLADPQIRFDLPFMRCFDDDYQARRALNALRAELERVRRPLVCASGTVLVLGNRKVVHARDSFTARYDGADRWLRKLIVSRSAYADSGEPYDRVRI